jgi:histidyl-tRNA synthetase
MESYKINKQARGFQILIDSSKERRNLLNKLIEIVEKAGFKEIILPAVEPLEIYKDKIGEEVQKQMFMVSKGQGEEELCLRPEGTATIQLLAQQHFKGHKDVMLWYFTPCYRLERPQAGRYREFYQFGVEWLNPRDMKAASYILKGMALEMVKLKTSSYVLNESAKRGLSYYIGDGFEISVESLGAQKQVVGGGVYPEGIGFALGFERLMLCAQETKLPSLE